MKKNKAVMIAISIILLCIPITYASEGNNQILNRINSFESQGMDEWFKTTIMFGLIANLSEERDFTSFEAVRLRYIQFNPFRVQLFNSREQLTIKNKYPGWVSSLGVVGIFRATTEEFEYEFILDALNDVINLEGELVDYPNIDIKEVTYSRVERKVILTVEVAGEIEKRIKNISRWVKDYLKIEYESSSYQKNYDELKNSVDKDAFYLENAIANHLYWLRIRADYHVDFESLVKAKDITDALYIGISFVSMFELKSLNVIFTILVIR